MRTTIEGLPGKAAVIMNSPRALLAALIVIWFVLIMYCLPVYSMVLGAVLTGGFSDNHVILSMFVSLISSPDDTFALYHKVLIPLVSGFAIVAFRNRATTTIALSLILFLLVSIAVSIGLSVYLSSSTTAASLAALKSTVFEFPSPLARQFLNRFQELLGTFLMMLLGLSASEAVELKKG